jgi:hypothetical protein
MNENHYASAHKFPPTIEINACDCDPAPEQKLSWGMSILVWLAFAAVAWTLLILFVRAI